MATQEVGESYARARSGKPPVGKLDTSPSHSTPGFTKPAPKAGARSAVSSGNSGSTGRGLERSHMASRAVKTGLKATPQGRAVSIASKANAARRRPKPGTTLRKLAPRSDKRTGSAFRKAGNHAPVLVAEYVLGLLLITIITITNSAKTGYNDAMSKAMLQASALTGVFFILFLMSSGQRASRVAAWFGVLVDLGILFTAVNSNAISDFASLVQGNGLPEATLLSSDKPQEFYQTSEAWSGEPTAVNSVVTPQ